MIDSVGTFYGIQDLFEDLKTRKINHKELLEGYTKYGSSTAKEICEKAKLLNWILIEESGFIKPTEIGLLTHSSNERPTILRFQIERIIIDFRPPWAALLTKGRKEALLGFPKEIRQCFEEALLHLEITEDIINWWDRLSMTMRDESNRQLLVTGRTGEKNSFEFEKQRTGCLPKWQAVESNFSGYDILSIKAPSDSRRLKIEVKASIRKFRDALINITEHEWRTALASPEDYIFHIWILSDESNDLYIIESKDIIPHIPFNNGKGNWKTVAISIGAITHPSKAYSFSA